MTCASWLQRRNKWWIQVALVTIFFEFCVERFSHGVVGISCLNYTENYLHDEGKNGSFAICSINGPNNNISCFEFAKMRNSEGPLIYGAGCGHECPVNQSDSSYDCKLCRTDMCNTALANAVRQVSHSCYTGPFYKSAMSARRKRRVWCAPSEKQCYRVLWTSKNVRKYFGGCGKMLCNQQTMNCSYEYCDKAMCNGVAESTPNPCSEAACGAAARKVPAVTCLICLALALLAVMMHLLG